MAFNGTHAVAPHNPSHYPHNAPYGPTDDDSRADGDYECVVCGYQTDITNEHAQFTRNWCRGECGEITTFKRRDNEN